MCVLIINTHIYIYIYITIYVYIRTYTHVRVYIYIYMYISYIIISRCFVVVHCRPITCWIHKQVWDNLPWWGLNNTDHWFISGTIRLSFTNKWPRIKISICLIRSHTWGGDATFFRTFYRWMRYKGEKDRRWGLNILKLLTLFVYNNYWLVCWCEGRNQCTWASPIADRWSQLV